MKAKDFQQNGLLNLLFLSKKKINKYHRVKKCFDELQVDERIGKLFQSRGIL